MIKVEEKQLSPRDYCIDLLGKEKYQLLIKGFKVTLKNERKVLKKKEGSKNLSWNKIESRLIYNSQSHLESVHKRVFGEKSTPDMDYKLWNNLIKAAAYELKNKI